VNPIKDRADFDARGGTKMKMIVTILQHRFIQNWMPQIVFHIDGTADYPPQCPPPQPADPQDRDAAELLAWNLQSSRKAILFQVFTSMREFIASCLTVNGIKCTWINGEMSFTQRAEAVERFRSDPEIRVLIISAVGGTGLNLAFADIVLFGVSSTILRAFSY
jgi:SNF2 family DNA or RNA helicase